MSLNNLVKRLQDIMRNDAGINGDAQRIEQMVWILFLKVYDAKEEIWEFTNTLQDKRVFFIDKNPDFGEVTRDSVKIYRVKYYGNNQPVDDVVYEE